MTQATKETFIKTCLQGKATTIKHYVYCILLKNPNQRKENLISLVGLNKTESKAIDELIYEGFIYDNKGVLIPMNDIVTITALHETQRLLKFRKDRDRFIKKHESRFPECLLMQLKSI